MNEKWKEKKEKWGRKEPKQVNFSCELLFPWRKTVAMLHFLTNHQGFYPCSGNRKEYSWLFLSFRGHGVINTLNGNCCKKPLLVYHFEEKSLFLVRVWIEIAIFAPQKLYNENHGNHQKAPETILLLPFSLNTDSTDFTDSFLLLFRSFPFFPMSLFRSFRCPFSDSSVVSTFNSSTRQLVNSSTCQLVNSSTCQLVNLSTRQLVNSSTCKS